MKDLQRLIETKKRILGEKREKELILQDVEASDMDVYNAEMGIDILNAKLMKMGNIPVIQGLGLESFDVKK